ncbi:hypothetical protein ABH900_000304 [Stenotrophomonas sp. AN71]|uniref:hypothetical protein n=1 Tax=Stenotrophomonas sp. AN71 TaxID=3156253 RepID=UPI003D236CBF
MNRLRSFFSAYPILFAMAAKLFVLCLYLPEAARLVEFGFRLGPPETSREVGYALADLGFRLCRFAGAAVLVSMLLFGRHGALWIRRPLIASIAFFGLLIVLDRAMRIPLAQLPFPVHSGAAISLAMLVHALVLTLLALVPALLMQRRVHAEGGHHHLISASMAGALALVAGSCLLPTLALQLPVGISPGEFIMPVADGAEQLQVASLTLLVACALATFAGIWAGAPSPKPASTVRRTVVSLILLATTLLIILASVAYLMRTLSGAAPTIWRGLAFAMVVGAALQFLFTRVLASRWLRVQAS